MVYVQATIKLRPGKLPEFMATLQEMLPEMARHGWRLVGCYATTVGRLNTVVDLWELPDANAIEAVMSDHALLAKFSGRLGECVEDETLAILTKLPIG